MGTNRWSLPTMRSGSGAGIPMGTGIGGSASYRAMPQNSMDAPNPQARLDWERQFFDADDVAVPNALEEDTHVSGSPSDGPQFGGLGGGLKLTRVVGLRAARVGIWP